MLVGRQDLLVMARSRISSSELGARSHSARSASTNSRPMVGVTSNDSYLSRAPESLRGSLWPVSRWNSSRGSFLPPARLRVLLGQQLSQPLPVLLQLPPQAWYLARRPPGPLQGVTSPGQPPGREPSLPQQRSHLNCDIEGEESRGKLFLVIFLLGFLSMVLGGGSRESSHRPLYRAGGASGPLIKRHRISRRYSCE